MKLLDTCFLIDLQREWVRGEAGVSRLFLEKHREEEFGISIITGLEFLEGYRELRDGERFLEPFLQFEVSAEVMRVGSRIRRTLRQRGELIGDFDILIAATAQVLGVPLVTDNLKHFLRVDGLVTERYR